MSAKLLKIIHPGCFSQSTARWAEQCSWQSEWRRWNYHTLHPAWLTVTCQKGEGPYHLEEHLSCCQRGREKAFSALLSSRNQQKLPPGMCKTNNDIILLDRQRSGYYPCQGTGFKIVNMLINRCSSLCKTLVSRYMDWNSLASLAFYQINISRYAV